MRKMKCILIDPPHRVVNLSKKRGFKEAVEQSAIYPPIGLAYIAAVLLENGIDVEIIDAKSLNLSIREVVETVRNGNPDFVGVTIFTTQYSNALSMCREIKRGCPDTRLVVGGPHINPEHREVIKNDFIDFCVRGEGEVTMLELIKAVSSGSDLKEVSGITFKDGNNIAVNPGRPFIKDLDTLPFPARDLLPNHLYKLEGNEAFTVMTATRGCPFRCNFCSVPQFWPYQRRRSVENILDELEHVYKEYRVSIVRFTGEVFTLNKKWVIRLCKGMIDRGLDKIKWSCDSRVDTISEEMFKAMKKGNCQAIFYGIEFGNQRILDFAGKGTTIAQIRKAVEMSKKVGFFTHSNFMVGYPTETKETIEDTITLARTVGVDAATFTVVTPFPGTKLYDYCKENNLLRTTNWDEYNYNQPEKGIIKLRNISDEELMKFYEKAHREFFFRHVRDGVRRELFDLLDLKEVSQNRSLNHIPRGGLNGQDIIAESS